MNLNVYTVKSHHQEQINRKESNIWLTFCLFICSFFQSAVYSSILGPTFSLHWILKKAFSIFISFSIAWILQGVWSSWPRIA
jgi:uncharacterized membrane protein YoaK (UPF0700 family)